MNRETYRHYQVVFNRGGSFVADIPKRFLDKMYIQASQERCTPSSWYGDWLNLKEERAYTLKWLKMKPTFKSRVLSNHLSHKFRKFSGNPAGKLSG